MTNYKAIGRKIRKLRKQENLTQEKLAELAGVDPKTIIELEAGRRANPTIRTLGGVARALKISLEDLFSS